MRSDRDELEEKVRTYFPVAAAIASVVISMLAWLVTVWDQSFIVNLLIALAASLLMTYLVFEYTKRISYSKRRKDYEVVGSTDVCKLIDPNGEEAVYRKILDLKFKQNTEIFELVLPPGGRLYDFNAYQVDNPSETYEVEVLGFDLPSLRVDMKRMFHKGQHISGLCLEWCIEDGFKQDRESISVSSDPSQERCEIKVIVPADSPSPEPTWFTTYGRRGEYRGRGKISPITERADGTIDFSHDFSDQLVDPVELRCVVVWNKGVAAHVTPELQGFRGDSLEDMEQKAE